MTHTVEALDETGQPVRVRCNSCGSQHNYYAPRSEPREAAPPVAPPHAVSFDMTTLDQAEPDNPELARIKRAVREVLRE
jgi:hypothetical protein